MAGLNINLATVAKLAQEIITLYVLWDRYKDDTGDPAVSPPVNDHHLSSGSSGNLVKNAALNWARSGSVLSGGTVTSNTSTPVTGEDVGNTPHTSLQHIPDIVTPSFLTLVLHKMREAKMAEINQLAASDVRTQALSQRTQASV